MRKHKHYAREGNKLFPICFEDKKKFIKDFKKYKKSHIQLKKIRELFLEAELPFRNFDDIRDMIFAICNELDESDSSSDTGFKSQGDNGLLTPKPKKPKSNTP